MSTIVGIDPSLTAAGIAILSSPATADTPNAPKLASVGVSGHRGASLPERSMRVGDQTARILKAMPPSVSLVMIEALPLGVPNPNAASLYQERAALVIRLVEWLTRRRIPVVDVSTSTLKKFATGDGRADKAAVVAAMRELWPHAVVRDDNQADALTLATMGAQRIGWHAPELLHHYEPNVQWPTNVPKGDR